MHTATVQPARRLRGIIHVPGDKSISHRAAMFNAIAEGDSVVRSFQRGEDCLSTLDCFRQLGVRWQWQGESALAIEGVGLRGLREPEEVLNCGNSGTTMRLLTGLLSPQNFFSVLSGDASLRSRPMGRMIEPLRLMGADISGRQDDSLAPLAIRGRPLRGIHYQSPVSSAQVKSAVLLAGLGAEGETILTEPSPSRDHTERLLAAMGADIAREGGTVRVRRTKRLAPVSLSIPGDISAAAFWLVAATVHPDAEITLPAVGVNSTRTGIVDALRAMGADIRFDNERLMGNEPVADITARSAPLHGAIFRGDLIPRLIDEAPLLVLAAALAAGETEIRDAAELRVKESDRIQSTAKELRKLGANIRELPDGFVINGPIKLKGGEVESHGDHRLAMTLAIAGLMAEAPMNISNAEAVAVSYSQFWRDIQDIMD